jgi:dipeptidyl aminopeptidase/acylaminoacyl peptidase
MPSMDDRSRHDSSRRITCVLPAIVLAAALAACSHGEAISETTEAPEVGQRASAVASPSVVEPAAGNGAIVFSRAAPSSVDGLPIDAVLRRSDDEGTVGRVVVEHATYRSAASWSPSGDAFAYLGNRGIWVWHAGDSALVAPCHPGSCVGYGPPSWSPTGDAIAFGGDRDGASSLFLTSPDGDDLHAIADIEILGAPTWSPDGSRIAIIASVEGTATIQILDAVSGDTTRTLDLADLRAGEALAWSPDGSALAVEVVGSDRGDHEGIYLMDLDGSAPTLLSACRSEGCADLTPAFSPDGRWVVFTRARCDEPGSDCFVGDLWVVPAQGGQAHALTQGPDLDCCAAWQPLAP